MLQHSEDHYIVSITFGEGAQSKDIQALRAVSEEWAQVSAAQAISKLKGMREVTLGSFESSEAKKLVDRCEALQLSVVCTPKKITNLSFYNEVTKRFAIIEDEKLLATLAKEAIAHGIPVRHSTV